MKEINDFANSFLSPLVVTHVREMSGHEMANIVAAERSVLPFGKRCKNFLLLRNINPDAYPQSTWLIEISYYSQYDPSVYGKIWTPFYSLPRLTDHNDFMVADVITIASDANDTPSFVYNHNTNALSRCFDFMKNADAVSHGAFPLKNINRLTVEAAELFTRLRTQGKFSERGQNYRAKRESFEPFYVVYTASQVREGYFSSLGKFFSISAHLIVYSPFVFVIIYGLAYLVYLVVRSVF